MFTLLATVVRNALQFGGGFVVSAGLATATDIDTYVGAVMSLIGGAWSIYNAYKEKKAEKAEVK